MLSTSLQTSNQIQVVIGADHGGFGIKEQVKEWLTRQGYQVDDAGAFTLNPSDDYPEIALAVAKKVVKNALVSQANVTTHLNSTSHTQPTIHSHSTTHANSQITTFGLLFCRSGGGMSIAANKVPGIRAVPVYSVQEAKHAREHNNAQIISLAGDWLDQKDIYDIIKAFLSTPFSQEERHVRRLTQIELFEQATLKDSVITSVKAK